MMQQQTSPSPSPPDFDFNLPCRYFKSSFARSLSMHNGGAGGVSDADDANDIQCKSLDFDIGQYRQISNYHNDNNNNNSDNNNSDINIDTKSLECPPLPQRRQPQQCKAIATTKNEADSSNNIQFNNTLKNNNNNNNAHFQSNSSNGSSIVEEDVVGVKPPALPARCPILLPKSKSAGVLNMQHRQQQQQQQQHYQKQQQQQQLAAQFRHVAIAENAKARGNAIVGVTEAAAATTATKRITTSVANVTVAHGNFNRPINYNKQQQPQQQQQHLNGQLNSCNNNNNNDALNSSRIGKSRFSLSNRRNAWPTDRDGLQLQQIQQEQHQQQQQQDKNFLFDVEDDLNAEVEDNNVDVVGVTMQQQQMQPVAAIRSTLTPHYATTTTSTPPPKAIAPRSKASSCIEQQQQRLNAYRVHNENTTAGTTTPTTTTANVQTVLLQNQVGTLQWQLKQVETSNEMYRAVIEEISRFLERYLTQKQQQRQLQQEQQIARSKSLYQVYDGNTNSICGSDVHERNTNGGDIVDSLSDKSNAASSSSCLRTRSTSNLIAELKQTTKTNNNTKHTTLATTTAMDKRNYDGISNMSNQNPYTAFKDFTWRRSPKKCAESKALAAANEVEDKLNKEAFRLSRTIQNLLNTSTRQPDLTQHRSGGVLPHPRNVNPHNNVSPQVIAHPPPTQSTGIPTLKSTAEVGNNNKSSNRIIPPPTKPLTANPLATTAEMLFLRANNIRDSRMSLRSSTDSSVHSTISNSSAVSSSSSSAASTSSSSKLETDDDVTLHHHHHPFHSNALPLKQLQQPLGSATEDESGFSSISSFQDIGVPLCSTMISNGTSTPNRLSLASVKLDGDKGNSNGHCGGGDGVDVELESNEFVVGDSRNSTLKANHPSNVLGVPLQATHNMPHRWDTTTVTKTNYRSNNKYQRFSTLSNEDAAAVLWV